jgi:adenine-specific DNA-methyltransferase
MDDVTELEISASEQHNQKLRGAFYTPSGAAESLVRWVVRSSGDRLLDPSCGDGRFLAIHQKSVGIEADANTSSIAKRRAPRAEVHQHDFFSWARQTNERFECAAGNPPFIRYQRFAGETRKQALDLCKSLGANFSGLTSSWAPFLVATASLLKPGGRMGFVVPAELGHAPYAKPLIEYLSTRFADVRVIAVKKKIFEDLSEDVWLLYADGYGGSSGRILLTSLESFSYLPIPPTTGEYITCRQLAENDFRLRPFLAGRKVVELYQGLCREPTTSRLAQLARVGIGYVTGDNEFFHLRPSQAVSLKIDQNFLQPTVRNGRSLKRSALTTTDVHDWYKRDEPVLLLSIPHDTRLPRPIQSYLDTEQGKSARLRYKCRVRNPWYVVPDVVVPDAFLTYMSGVSPSLVRNLAGCACTNSVHAVLLKRRASIRQIQEVWNSPFTQLSCEIQGHPLGGGMLKIEPREAGNIALAYRKGWANEERLLIEQGLQALREWRHCGGGKKQATPM